MNINELAKKLECKYNGRDFEVKAINTLDNATKEEISFLDNKKYVDSLKETNAGAVFIEEKYLELLPDGVEALISYAPYLSMARATSFFAKKLIREELKSTISKNCTIERSVHLGHGCIIEDNATILSNSVIGENVKIGEGTIIYPNVTIYNDTIIGKNCIIHANSVIGTDGFGYAHTKEGEHIKIHHNGNVILEDNVEIGANSCVDRAVFATTIIKEGSKIDNLVQIGHNAEVGERCIMVSQSGLSGSTKLGRNVVMGGQAATAGHIEIGDFATIAARGGVTKSIKGGEVYSGFPLMKHKDWLKLQAKILKYFNK